MDNSKLFILRTSHPERLKKVSKRGDSRRGGPRALCALLLGIQEGARPSPTRDVPQIVSLNGPVRSRAPMRKRMRGVGTAPRKFGITHNCKILQDTR